MKSPPRISEAEWLVMHEIWARGHATALEVVDALEPLSHWKPKTVMTLINRLVKKGALRFEKEGRAYRYFPCVDEDDCVRAESRSFLKRVYGGAAAPMLMTFLQEARLSKKEIEELKRILNERGKQT